MQKKPTCREPSQPSERNELDGFIAAAFVSLAFVCAWQSSARAHYDLQNHNIYDSAHSHHGDDSGKPIQSSKSRSHVHSKHTKALVHSNMHGTKSKAYLNNSTTKSNSKTHGASSRPPSKCAPNTVSVHRHSGHSHGGFDPWKLLESAISSPAYAFSGHVSIILQGQYRVIRSNGLPDHQTGAFPNEGNPNTISEQHYEYRVPKDPKKTGQTVPLGMNVFGVAINGVPFDPGAAERYEGNPRSGWQYEAMYLGARLGIDQNNAHVQPNGAYHYHGIPTGLMQKLASYGKPILLGYAADGFPIYGPFGYKNPQDKNSGLKKLKSSYRFKSGSRPSSPGPGGRYDGAFTEDYEYAKSLGDLDDSNGRFAVTPEYPQGIYQYVVTDQFPYIPRSYKGSPDESFQKRRPGGGFRPGGAQTRPSSGQRQQGGNLWGRPPEEDDFRGPGDGFGPPDGGPRGDGGPPGRGGPEREGPPGQGGPPDRDGGPPGRSSSARDGGASNRAGGPPGRRPPPPGRIENGGDNNQGGRSTSQQGRSPQGNDDMNGPPPFGPGGMGGPPPEDGDGPPFGPGNAGGPPPFGPPPQN